MQDLILVTGSEGLVGSRFIEISENKNNFHFPTQIEMDITNPAEIKAILASFNFRAVVHFAAFTDVSEAENERGNRKGDCWLVNYEGTKNLVEAVKNSGKPIHFVHISTDMVFSGSKVDKGPYTEDHKPETDLSNLTWYGYSKAEAERTIRKILGNEATIIRLIYPVRASFEPKLDYIRLPLSLYDQGKLYPLFSDQQISISYIDEVCKVIDVVLNNKHYGTFHAASIDRTTPYELIKYVIQHVRDSKAEIAHIKLDDYLKKTASPKYRYPKFGGLDVKSSEKILGIKFNDTKTIANELIAQGLGK